MGSKRMISAQISSLKTEVSHWGRRDLISAVLTFVISVVLFVVSFPPFDLPEAAYVLAVPFLLWCYAHPPRRLFLGTVFLAGFIGWVVLIFWLRHVTIGGLVFLAFYLTLYYAGWFAMVRWALPRMIDRTIAIRLVGIFALAGLWVLLEYVRGCFLTGFLWLPLAASQWERPLMLQSASYAGAWSVSFALIFFNLAIAAYMQRMYRFYRERKGRFCPEFYLALILVFVVSFGLYRKTIGQERKELMRAGVMQPYIPQEAKWDQTHALEILEILERVTLNLKALEPDVMFWPEAVTPYAVIGDQQVEAWIEDLVSKLDVTLFLGAVAIEKEGGPDEEWYNGVMMVEPKFGLYSEYYRKRHLVPFGEYVPLRSFFPWAAKFVPIGGDFIPGESAELLPLSLPDRRIEVGSLICYEDVFPSLARQSVRDGAGFLYVATNNAWYGEEGSAYQHAAHSVLRAVETRRVVLRVGNGGWSGWIDEFGVIRNVYVDGEGSIYARGGTVFNLTRDQRWVGRESFYVKHGDWFVLLCLGFVSIGFFVIYREEKRQKNVGEAS
jgi:apolipoprotein N-acyltransferase